MAAPDIRPIVVPDHYTVWAASDLHGQVKAVEEVLRTSGLTDEAGHWSAPAATALVVTGDLVDRGPDSVGLVRRLATLRTEAEEAGGIVALLEGNHEMQVLGGLDAVPEIWHALVTFGGAATFLSAGLQPEEWGPGAGPEDVAARIGELAPDFLPLLWTFASYATWGDVLFVHGGPVPNEPSLRSYERSARRLWIRDAFYASPRPFPEADEWTLYREAGMRRVVFGHTPVAEPVFSHDGRALNVDTWRGGRVTLARLEPGAPLTEAAFVSAPAEPRAVSDAPVTPEQIRGLDAALPAVVDRWIAARFGLDPAEFAGPPVPGDA